MADLAEFLSQAARTPFAWDAKNCLTWPADWVRLQRGVDLAEGFRGRFTTALGCRRFLTRQGGLLAFTEARAEACGLVETAQPAAGDIGIVMARTARGLELTGAIRTDRRWAVLSSAGVACAPFATVKAWKV